MSQLPPQDLPHPVDKAASGPRAARRRTSLAPRSAKRQAEDDARWETVAEVKARDGVACYARNLVPEVRCGGELDPHEIIPRSAWPGGHLVATNVRMVCRRHHDWIGAEPDDAHERGLHGYSWERPGHQPGDRPYTGLEGDGS